MKSNTPRWMVVVLWIVAAMDLVTGIEMFFFPATWFFKLVPGVPETGQLNAHLVMDGGTFFTAVGIGLVAAAWNPRRNAIAVVIAAIAGVMHSVLHVWSHAEGLLSLKHLMTEVVGIYIPAILLIVIAVALYRRPVAAENVRARAA